MKIRSVTILAAAILVSTSGCATIRGGAIRDVRFTSNPPGATVQVTDPNGTVVFTGATPTLARLRAGAGYFQPAQYTASFERAGFVSYQLPIRARIDWFSYGIGNIPLAGFPGWIWVDPRTGAMWALERRINVTLNPVPERPQ